MAEYIRGLKAGIISGLIIGIVNAIVAAFIYWFMLESISGEMSEGWIKVGFYTLSLLIPGKIIFGIIGSVIFGLIFATFYNKLPGSKPIVNAILIAIIYWLTFSVLIGHFSKEYYLAAYGITYIADVIIGFIMYLFWGFLLVIFWNKYSKKQKK
jgi:uncharacterized membrane protein YeaQ/YmgE (transglycosylase-associated protein family)